MKSMHSDYRWLILLKCRRRRKTKDICNYHKEPSHWKKDCPKKAKNDFAYAIVQNDSSSKNDLVMSVGEQLEQHFEQWVLDSVGK